MEKQGGEERALSLYVRAGVRVCACVCVCMYVCVRVSVSNVTTVCLRYASRYVGGM